MPVCLPLDFNLVGYCGGVIRISQISKIELFGKTVNGFQLYIIFSKKPILYVWDRFEYASVLKNIELKRKISRR